VDSPAFDALPRGRHRLTREQVAASQRERMLQGVTEAVGEKGYAHSSVADVLKRARVSRETFYEHFTGKQDCFLAAYQRAADLLMDTVKGALGPPGRPALQRLEPALAAYLGVLATDAAVARTFLLEIHAVGPPAAERRYAVHRRFVELAVALVREDELWRALPEPEFACQMVIGGVATLVSGKVAAGEHATLPALNAPVLAHVRTLLGHR
jgi:AcrR family transcriptional regulator